MPPPSLNQAGRPRSLSTITSSLRGLSLCRERVAIGTQADPVMLEVFNNLFMSIAEQMGGVLQNTSYSVNIKERLDFLPVRSFDTAGDLVANAPHIPVHLGSMSESVKTVARQRESTMKPGDVLHAQHALQRRHTSA